VAATSVDVQTLHEPAPDTRGPSAPISATALWLGIASLVLVIGGVAFTQLNYALSDRVLTASCIEAKLTPDITGAVGVCNIVEALRSPATTAALDGGIVLGIAAMGLGWGVYRRMDSRRRREQAVTGAVLGVQAVAVAIVLLLFRAGRPELFAKHFLNFTVLTGYFPGAFFAAMKNTIVLAVGGEVGGIVIGVVLAMLVISSRRAVRAPARVYINFFRGTPLIWQLATGFFVLLLGFGIVPNTFALAMGVFALNTGAYAAEVFRAGIQSIERGQIEAARSLGMSWLQAMRYAIVPQAVRRVIPPLMNEFVILIKDTALVIVLGLLESQNDLFQWARSGQADTFNATFFTATALGYLAITLPAIRLVNAIERRLRSGLVGIAGAGH
jgi:polar amino acid transport system permease protein